MSDKALLFNIQRFSIHDGPGIRTSVFYKGCPLRCSWCANPESWRKVIEPFYDSSTEQETTAGYFMSVEEIMQEVRKDIDFYKESNGGVTVTGGEVLAQKDNVIKLLKQLRKENIHSATETSAYASLDEFKELVDNVDMLIMDVKHYDTDKHKEKTGVHNEQILKNLAYAVSIEKEMLVRVPIIPGFNNSENDAHKFGELFKAYQVKEIELLPFHQFGSKKYEYLNRDYEYEGVKSLEDKDLIPLKDIIESYGVKCV